MICQTNLTKIDRYHTTTTFQLHHTQQDTEPKRPRVLAGRLIGTPASP